MLRIAIALLNKDISHQSSKCAALPRVRSRAVACLPSCKVKLVLPIARLEQDYFEPELAAQLESSGAKYSKRSESIGAGAHLLLPRYSDGTPSQAQQLSAAESGAACTPFVHRHPSLCQPKYVFTLSLAKVPQF